MNLKNDWEFRVPLRTRNILGSRKGRFSCLAEGALRVISRSETEHCTQYLQKLDAACRQTCKLSAASLQHPPAEVVEGLLSRPTVDSQLIDDSLLIRLNELVQDTEGLPNCKFNKC